jgi:hypothetical protein
MSRELIESLKFPIQELPLYLGNGASTGLRAIYNANEGNAENWLGYHTKEYKVTTNAELIDTAIPIIEEMGAKIQDVSSRYTFCDDKRMYLGLVLDQKFEIQNGKSDLFNMLLFLKNSYDGSLSYGCDFGSYRLVCTNGAVSFIKTAIMKRKHVTEFSPDLLRYQIETALTEFPKLKAAYERFHEKNLTKEELDRIFSDAEKRNLTTKTQSDNIQGLIGETKNAYLIFNILTYYLTHIATVYERSHQFNAFVHQRLMR